ncbi:hypothetical protein NIES4074_61360 (plasmid) [Cylindrospermum sp. NIES-4074]|nr:hypothetical protein NIES4074_61360 [Cylindrospermum sp. NIES-4074]
MINYLHLRGYRNLCEYLNQQWYKFAEVEDIKKRCKGILPTLYDPNDKRFANYLWNQYLIQFVYYGKHPILNYTNSNKIKRKYKDTYGWVLISDWEYKVDYLEKIILFNKEPIIKLWEPNLRKRINERQRRKTAEQLRNRFRLMTDSEAILEAQKLGICWRCFNEIIPMMIDCVRCGAKQDTTQNLNL